MKVMKKESKTSVFHVFLYTVVTSLRLPSKHYKLSRYSVARVIHPNPPQSRLPSYCCAWTVAYLLTSLLSNAIQHSPSWEANRFSAKQKIPRIWWNPKVHYRIHKCQPPVPILNQIDPVHTLLPDFLKIHLNIIFPSTPGSHKWFFSPQVSPTKPSIRHSFPHTPYVLRPSHSSCTVWISNIQINTKDMISWLILGSYSGAEKLAGLSCPSGLQSQKSHFKHSYRIRNFSEIILR